MKGTSGDRSRLRQGVILGLPLAFMVSFAGGCRSGTGPAARETAAAQPPAQPTAAALPVAAIAPAGRAELLAAFAAAADEVAAGKPLPGANRDLIDRSFELRLPFGCGAGLSAEWAQWSIDPETGVLRISVRPAIRGDDRTIKALAAGLTFDAAEGFWLERPWTRSEDCPASPPAVAPEQPDAGPEPATVPDALPLRTFALVQYFSPDAPRTLRRGSRPYSYTGKVADTETVGTKGFRLRLAGRIRGFGDGQPIHCAVTAPSRPPVCAAAVEFSQVVLENADTGESLAEWNS